MATPPTPRPVRFARLDRALRRLFRTELRYAHRHLLGLLVVLIVLQPLLAGGGYLLGLRQGQAHDAQYYAQLIKFNGHQPPSRNRLALEPVQPVRSATGAVLWKFFNTKPENQGSVGQCNCYSFVREYDDAFYKQTGLNHHFSCRFLYGLLMELYRHGADYGSNFGDYPPLLSSYGSPRLRQYDYVGQPSTIEYPPATAFAQAALHKYSVVEHIISTTYSSGPGVIERMEWALHYGHPLDCGLDVTVAGTGGFLDANQNGGFIDADPARPQPTIGGHAVTCVEYDRNLCHTSQWGHTCGFFKIKNQWPHWGLNRLGQPSDGGNFAYVSYRYYRLYGNGVAWLSVHKNNPPRLGVPPIWYQPGPSGGKSYPAPRTVPTHRLCIGCDRYVYHVFARDSGVDLAPYINRVATQTGLSATGFMALLATECGLKTGSPQCDREAGGLDFSYGPCQVTIATAHGFGVGNGIFDGHYGPNASYVRAYEDTIATGIPLCGRVAGSYRNYELSAQCYAASQYPGAYVPYNEGPARSCGDLTYPSGTAAANYANYLGWYSYAQAYGSATDRYATPPAPFPRARWGSAVAPYYHGHLTRAARYWWRGHQRLGRARAIHYYAGRPGYHKVSFAHHALFCFDSGRCKLGPR